MTWFRQNYFVLISVGLFVLSLTQESYYIDRTNPAAWASSPVLLLIGWLGFLSEPTGAGIAWLANPFIFLSWIFYFVKKPKLVVMFSVLASITAGSFLMYDTVISSEAPTFSRITEYKLGYWLWLSSCLYMAAFSVISTLTKNRR